MNKLGRRDFLKLISLLGLTPFLETGCTAEEKEFNSSETTIPNVFIIILDTLSALHIPLHGYPRNTTPKMMDFAEHSTVYHRHYSAGNFTVPGTASLLTGTYPWSHRALHHTGLMCAAYEQQNLFTLFAETHQRIAYPHNLWANLLLHQLHEDIDQYIHPESFSLIDDVAYDSFQDTDIAFRSFEELLFRDIGVPGSLFLSRANDLKVLIDKQIGLKAYSESFPRGVPSLGTYNVYYLLEQVVQGVVSSIAHFHPPFLAYLHFFPPHEPYCPSHDFIGMFEDTLRLPQKPQHFFSQGYPDNVLNRLRMEYDEYIAYADNELGQLLNSLEENGYMDNSYIILTSDHGQLFERGVHGHDTPLIYESILRVPLMISKPGQDFRQDVYTPTSSVDILPSLLQLFGRDIPSWCEGKPLPGILTSEEETIRSIFAVEAKRNPMKAPLQIGTVALIRGRYKLIHYFGYTGYANEFELYDLENDPNELEDLSQSRIQLSESMEMELREKLSAENSRFH